MISEIVMQRVASIAMSHNAQRKFVIATVFTIACCFESVGSAQAPPPAMTTTVTGVAGPGGWTTMNILSTGAPSNAAIQVIADKITRDPSTGATTFTPYGNPVPM